VETSARASTKIAVFLLLLLQSSVLYPQSDKTKKEATNKGRLTFKLPVGVVVVNATVTDKQGTTVADLTQNDFKVYEDGKLQSIQTFAAESYKPMQASQGTTQTSASKAATTAEPNFTRPRLISIIIDDLASEPEDRFIRVTNAVKKFVETDMVPGDQMEIFSGSGSVQYPFSDDKQLLLEEVASLPLKLKWSRVARSDCPVLTDLQAQMIYNQRDDGVSLEVATAEVINCLGLDPKQQGTTAQAQSYARSAAFSQYQETHYRGRTLLLTLRRHLGSLKHFDAAKSVILLSDGFLREDVTYELQDVVEQALRAGVVFNTIDIRGVYTILPPDNRYQDATTVPMKQGMYSQDALAREDPLAQLAGETGGVFYHNSNDLHQGIQEISSRQDYYYVLTYTVPTQKPDGRYHSIKVEVTRPGLKVSYRKGYYAPKEEMTFERRKKEDVLEALQAPGNLNEIPMGLSYNYYQDDDTTYVVSLLMKVDIRRLHFLEEDSRHKNVISMVVVAYDENDHYIDGLDKSVDFRLTDESYASLLDRGLTSKIEFKLTLGRYKIKAVVREASQGKMGSLTKAIEIP